MGRQQLTQVDSYEYLGTRIHQTGKSQGEVRKREQKATNAYYALSRCLFGNEEVDKKTKTRVYQAVLEPILLYGSESWAMTKNDISQFSTNEVPTKNSVENTKG